MSSGPHSVPIVTVIDATTGTSQKFSAVYSKDLLEMAWIKFGPGLIENQDGICLTNSSEPLVEGVYRWKPNPGAGDDLRLGRIAAGEASSGEASSDAATSTSSTTAAGTSKLSAAALWTAAGAVVWMAVTAHNGVRSATLYAALHDEKFRAAITTGSWMGSVARAAAPAMAMVGAVAAALRKAVPRRKGGRKGKGEEVVMGKTPVEETADLSPASSP